MGCIWPWTVGYRITASICQSDGAQRRGSCPVTHLLSCEFEAFITSVMKGDEPRL